MSKTSSEKVAELMSKAQLKKDALTLPWALHVKAAGFGFYRIEGLDGLYTVSSINRDNCQLAFCPTLKRVREFRKVSDSELDQILSREARFQMEWEGK